MWRSKDPFEHRQTILCEVQFSNPWKSLAPGYVIVTNIVVSMDGIHLLAPVGGNFSTRIVTNQKKLSIAYPVCFAVCMLYSLQSK